MGFLFEKKKLESYLGKTLYKELKENKAYISGGAITSLFTNKEINDIDVYFRDEDDIVNFLTGIWGNGQWIVSQTNKATLILYEDIKLQLIHFDYFKTPQDIFNTFDFTACMGCYDFTTESFVLHDDFMKHNSQRLLQFNKNTAFPIVSLLRVQKYQDKGYYISKPEFIRIILSCMDLDINTYEELKEQLGGMYGVNYDKLFKDIEEEEFDLSKAIDKIANLSLDDDYFKKPDDNSFEGDLEDLLQNISVKPVTYFEHDDCYYKIGYDGLLRELEDVPKNNIKITVEDFFIKNKLYKYVKKVNDKYYSFYDNKFEYIIGSEVEANTNRMSSYNNKRAGKLHFNEKQSINQSSYSHENNRVLIEVSIKGEDFEGVDNVGHLMAKKCFVIREVPETEWKSWKNDSSNEGEFFELN